MIIKIHESYPEKIIHSNILSEIKSFIRSNNSTFYVAYNDDGTYIGKLTKFKGHYIGEKLVNSKIKPLFEEGTEITSHLLWWLDKILIEVTDDN